MATTATGAVQVPVPHSDPTVLQNSPEHQPPPQGGTESPIPLLLAIATGSSDSLPQAVPSSAYLSAHSDLHRRHGLIRLPPAFLQNCAPFAPVCKDTSSLRTSPTLPAMARPPGGVLRYWLYLPAGHSSLGTSSPTFWVSLSLALPEGN